MALESILEKIEKAEKKANSPLPSDSRTKIVKLGHIKRAKEDLKTLAIDYRTEVSKRCLFVISEGKASKDFADKAESDFGCFSVGAEELYEKIAEPVNKRYYDNQQSSPALFDILMSSFNEICDDVGIVGYPAVLFESKYVKRLKSKEDLISLVMKAFNEKVGSDLVGLYAITKVSRKALDSKFKGKVVPIIIHTENKDLAEDLKKTLKNLSQNVFVVSSNRKNTEKSVEKKLLEIRSKVK